MVSALGCLRKPAGTDEEMCHALEVSLTALLRFIPGFFFSGAVVNGIFFLVSFSASLFLALKKKSVVKATDFSYLNFISCNLTENGTESFDIFNSVNLNL